MYDLWTILATVIGGLVLMSVFKRILTKNKIYKSYLSMTDKTVIITGANVGIGKASALDLASRNARVILACRDLEKANTAIKDIRKVTQDGKLVAKHLDLSSMSSINKFCLEINEEEPKLDVLINNAGIFQCPYAKTTDGFEMQMGVNHFGHFLLTNNLLDLLKKSSPSRVVVVSSALHKRGQIKFDDIHSEVSYTKSKGYADSKLANALFSRELSKKLEGTGVNVYCVHPGMVWTNLSRHVLSPIMAWILTPLAILMLKTSTEGCETVVYCSIEPELSKETGLYYGNCRSEAWSPAAMDDSAAKKLWELSLVLTDKR